MGSRLPCARARTHACACDRASGPPPDRPLCAGGTWHPPRCFGFWFSSAHHGLGKHSTSFRQPKFPERRPVLHPKEGSWARRPPEVPESPGEPRPSANASRGNGRKAERERPQLRPGRMPLATSSWLGLGRRGLSKAPLRHVPWAGSGESPPPGRPSTPSPEHTAVPPLEGTVTRTADVAASPEWPLQPTRGRKPGLALATRVACRCPAVHTLEPRSEAPSAFAFSANPPRVSECPSPGAAAEGPGAGCPWGRALRLGGRVNCVASLPWAPSSWVTLSFCPCWSRCTEQYLAGAGGRTFQN